MRSQRKLTDWSLPDWKSEKETMVSVIVAAYNHERFIPQMLEGFLKQEVDFRVEILINDDASTDGTAAVLKKYENNYPFLFKNFYQPVNLYSQGIKPWFDILIPATTGKYIAICDGDDYWTDPLKLQKQVGYLEKHPKCTVCYHRVESVKDDGSVLVLNNQKRVEDYQFDFVDSLKHKHGATLGMVFRKEIVEKYDMGELFKGMAMSDWPLECLCTLEGDGYFMDECMGVYRRHDGSVSKGFNAIDHYNSRIKFLNNLLERALISSKKAKGEALGFLYKVLIDKSNYLFKNDKVDNAKATFADLLNHLIQKGFINKKIPYKHKLAVLKGMARFLSYKVYPPK